MSKITKSQQEAFLEHLAQTANATDSAKVSGIRQFDLYRMRREDEDFRVLWDEAFEIGQATCEDSARRRAFQGYEKPVYQGGIEVGRVREYSDTLAKFILEADKPEKFRRTKTVELQGLDALARSMSDAELNEAIEKYTRRVGVDSGTIEESKVKPA